MKCELCSKYSLVPVNHPDGRECEKVEVIPRWNMVCTGSGPCPMGLQREFYYRDTGQMVCIPCPAEIE